MLILLPPSEGKSHPARGASLDLATLAFPTLTTARERVVEALIETCSGPEAGRILGLGPTQAAEIAHNRELWEAPTARADRIYTGVLYDALDLGSLPTPARSRATRWLAITSSVFGFLRPADRIPAYRLSGDVTLPGLGGVAAHWRAALATTAPEAVGDGLLIDLRSQAYVTFWKPPADLAAATATVRVLHDVAGRRKVVSHFNKATKGHLVRALLDEGAQPKTPTALGEVWSDLGWDVEVGMPGPGGTRLDVVVSDPLQGHSRR